MDDGLKALVVEMLDNLKHCSLSSGCCHCGDNMDRHSDPMSCGHTPVDMGWTAAESWIEKAEATLAPPSPHPIVRVSEDTPELNKSNDTSANSTLGCVSEDTAGAVERAVAKAVYYSGCGLTCPYRDIISGRCERHGPTEADLIVERVTAGFRRDLKSIIRSEK